MDREKLRRNDLTCWPVGVPYIIIESQKPFLFLTFSVFSSPVVLDERGLSRGYGFIRFNNEVEQQTAMTSMNGMSGLGGKPIKVSAALNRIKEGMDRCGHEGRRVPNQVLNDVLGKSFQ